MKTPAVVMKPWKRVGMDNMVVERKLIRADENISPFDSGFKRTVRTRRRVCCELRKPFWIGGATLHRASMARIRRKVKEHPGWLEEREDGKVITLVDTDQYAIGLENDTQDFMTV